MSYRWNWNGSIVIYIIYGFRKFIWNFNVCNWKLVFENVILIFYGNFWIFFVKVVEFLDVDEIIFVMVFII